jgi:hypothetical protein
MKIRKINTTAYHPQTNGLDERFNGTLCNMLSVYSNANQTDWDKNLPIVLFAYRISIQETTNMSPFELLYGRQPRLPSSLDVSSTHPVEVYNLDKVWNKARLAIVKAAAIQKTRYDGKYPEYNFQVGEKVRLHWPVTPVGLVKKLRKDIYRGPYEILEVHKNGNVLINMDNKPYLTHSNRIKPAEKERDSTDKLDSSTEEDPDESVLEEAQQPARYNLRARKK